MEYNPFKKLIYEHVNSWANACTMGTILLYPKLDLYFKCTEGISMWTWWIVCAKYPMLTNSCKLLARFLFRETCLQADCYKFSNVSKSIICMFCTTNSKETAQHVLFECQAYRDIRCKFWRRMEDTCPIALQHCMKEMSPEEKTLLILNCLGNSYVAEWTDVYVNILKFVAEIYSARKRFNVQ